MDIKRAQIELSSKCNFKCITCRHGYYDYGQHLASPICDMLCDELIPKLNTLELQGTGESLLNPRISDIISIASKSINEITLITNASMLYEEIIRQFICANIQLVVSLDGADSKVFSMHRPVGNFESIVSNLSLIKKIRSEYEDTSFSLTVNMVLTRMNYSTIPDMIELLSKVGADFLFVSEVRECMPDKKKWNNLNILDLTSESEFELMLADCASIANKNGLGFSFNPNKKLNMVKKKICEAPWRHVFIAANGDVSVCCELSKSFGNLEKNNLSDILACDEMQEFRNNMLLGDYDSHCINCCLPWGLPY